MGYRSKAIWSLIQAFIFIGIAYSIAAAAFAPGVGTIWIVLAVAVIAVLGEAGIEHIVRSIDTMYKGITAKEA